MTGGHPRAAGEREPGGRGVALVARPGLQVAALRRRRRALDGQLDPHARAQVRAEPRVVVALGPQPVVEVQRAYGVRAGDPHRQVEQADRVLAAGEQHDDRRAGDEQPARADPRLDRGGGGGRAHGARRARKSSSGREKPLSLTSPMWVKASRRSAASTSGRVTSTSPPAARAPTREATLTALP